MNISDSRMRVQGLGVKPLVKNLAKPEVTYKHKTCLPTSPMAAFGRGWLSHSMAEGFCFKAERRGGVLNTGGVAVARPFCSPLVQKGPSSKGLRCGA